MNTMTTTEIRIAMAELEGWKRGYTEAAGRATFFVVDPHGFQRGWSKLQDVADSALPDYCNDLNAVHRVAMHLAKNDPASYGEYHLDVFKEFGVDATARQRCEAILRTVGKWKE